MNRNPYPFAAASRWEVGVVVAVLVAAAACCGQFFFSVDQVLSAGSGPNSVFAVGDGGNPWAHLAVTGNAGRETSPTVRSASLHRAARTPAF
jgi:hypothetical protein